MAAGAASRVPWFLWLPLPGLPLPGLPLAGRGVRNRPAIVFRSCPGVAPWLQHEGSARAERRRGQELLPPGVVLHQAGPLAEHRQGVQVAQIALKRPVVLGHVYHVSCREKRATREVLLERKVTGRLELI